MQSRPTARRIPTWMLKLMHDRGSHEAPPRSRSRSRRRDGVPDHLGDPVPSRPALAMTSRPAGAQEEEVPRPEQDRDITPSRAGSEGRSCDLASAPAETLPTLAPSEPLSAEGLTRDAHDHSRADSHAGHRDSYGEFSSASSTASSSTSYSGFDSRSASSVTSASSATTFSAASWTGQAASPGTSASSFEGRKRSPAGFASREHSHKGAPFLGDLPPSSAESEGDASHDGHAVDEATLKLSHLSFPSSVEVHAPEEADTTPGASSTLLAPPSPAQASVVSVETATTGPSPTAPPSLPDDGTLLAPENFATVSADLFRSSFPRREHFPFMKNLGLKSVMVLVQEPYPEENAKWLKQEGIQLFQFGIPGNKEPFVSIPDDKVVAALTTILDKRNHPMLIHCNKGKHRTGCVIGCLRRIQSWSLTSIFDEYRRYSTPKSRAMDLQFIEAFGGLPDVWRLCDRDQLPTWPTLEPPPIPIPPPSEQPVRPP
ncbi:hypothetical protein JCM8202_002595 [Rhodotorula sphaerocarpa]